MTSRRLKITIDTNCVINLFDAASQSATSVEELQALFRYALSGTVELSATTRVEADLRQDRNELRRAELLRHLAIFPIIGTVARWDTSTWDGGDFFADDASERLSEEVQRILSPGLTPADKRFSNKINDIDHLVGHAHAGRDLFVTDDGGILRRAPELAQALGIRVMTPAACLAAIEEAVARTTVRALPDETISPRYHNRAHRGSVTLDYSNNNGRYALGDGHCLFETAWSKGDGSSIHAYHDPASIDAIAIAQSATSIDSVTDAASYDYSSRTRSPRIGQVLLWRNQNGLYAATQIGDIKDDTRYDGPDALTFDYVVLADGGTDFSRA